MMEGEREGGKYACLRIVPMKSVFYVNKKILKVMASFLIFTFCSGVRDQNLGITATVYYLCNHTEPILNPSPTESVYET